MSAQTVNSQRRSLSIFQLIGLQSRDASFTCKCALIVLCRPDAPHQLTSMSLCEVEVWPSVVYTPAAWVTVPRALVT